MLSVSLIVLATLFLPLEARRTSADVVTYHNDNLRTGWYARETRLTQANVGSGKFGILTTLPTDGNVYAQPLYLHGVRVSGGTHNVLLVATEYDSVYAFDADTGATLWHTSFIDPSQGITPAASGSCNQIEPWVGISSTPVVDRAAATVYLVAKTQHTLGSTVTYANTLHDLSLVSGKDVVAPVLITGSAATATSTATTYTDGCFRTTCRL